MERRKEGRTDQHTIHNMEGLKITINHSGIFFVEERIKRFGDHKISKAYNEKTKSYEDIYSFRKDNYDVIIAKTQTQITLREDLEDESYIDILEKLFKNRDWLWSIKEISAIYMERYVAREYQELEKYGIQNLLPNLKEEESRATSSLVGELGNWDWKIINELYRCQASLLDTDNAIAFSSSTIMETENQSNELEEILETIKNTSKHARTYRRIPRLGQKDL